MEDFKKVFCEYNIKYLIHVLVILMVLLFVNVYNKLTTILSSDTLTGFGIFVAVKIWVVFFFCVMVLHSLVGGCQHFRGTYYYHLYL